jgi:hypothetical protein
MKLEVFCHDFALRNSKGKIQKNSKFALSDLGYFSFGTTLVEKCLKLFQVLLSFEVRASLALE